MQMQKNPPGAVGGTQTTNFNRNFGRNGRRFQEPITADPDYLVRQAMENVGIAPPSQLIWDGKLHRFHDPNDKPNTKHAWYTLHRDPPASGAFGNWRSGVRQIWCSGSRDSLTLAERETIQRRIESAKLERQQEEERRHRAAQQRALNLLKTRTPANAWNRYILRKCILTHGLRVCCWTESFQDDSGVWRKIFIENTLLIPMRDFDGELWAVQGIFPEKIQELGNRDKSFLPGARKSGLFFLFGKIDPNGTLLLAEGYATAATLFETLGEPVLCCFDAGNLQPVAVECRRRFPAVDLVIACDNDRHTPGNPGLTKGRAAALASGARLLIPPFADGEPGTDWNDLVVLRKGAANV